MVDVGALVFCVILPSFLGSHLLAILPVRKMETEGG